MRMRRTVRSLLLSITLSASAVPLWAYEEIKPETLDQKSWSQFLGPNRNGISTESGLIDSIDPSKSIEAWRQPMLGGLSGISIVNDRLLTLSQSEGKQWLMALDTATGKQVWKSAIGAAYQNSMGNGPRSTPTVEDETVFAYSGEGILVSANLSDGKIRWSKDLPKELQCKPSEYGMSCSPLLHDSKVIVHVGSKDGAVVALDQKTGTMVWKSGDGEAGYSSPTIMTLSSIPQLVSVLGNQVLGMDPKSGKVLWSHPFATEFACNTACPIQIGEGLLVSSGENHGSVLLGVEKKGESWNVVERWNSFGSTSSLRSEWQTPILIDGCLYGFDNVGSAGPVTHLTCIDASTGKSLWKKLRFGKGNLIAADGKLIVSNTEGEIVLVKASKEGYQELGRKQIVGFSRQAPVLCNGKVYMRDEAEIVCLDFTKK